MQVFTTHHWMVRIYKLKPPKNRIRGKTKKLKSVCPDEIYEFFLAYPSHGQPVMNFDLCLVQPFHLFFSFRRHPKLLQAVKEQVGNPRKIHGNYDFSRTRLGF